MEGPFYLALVTSIVPSPATQENPSKSESESKDVQNEGRWSSPTVLSFGICCCSFLCCHMPSLLGILMVLKTLAQMWVELLWVSLSSGSSNEIHSFKKTKCNKPKRCT
jgi:hypothetical protein